MNRKEIAAPNKFSCQIGNEDMESTVGWIELSPAALRRMRGEPEDAEEGVVDEMGVLAIHSGYADRFFPGTSVPHTRHRYLFFTCRNYLKLAEPAQPYGASTREMTQGGLFS